MDRGRWSRSQDGRKKGKAKGGPAETGGRILPTSLNGNSGKSGSRFNILNTHEENLDTIIGEKEVQGEDIVAPIIMGVNVHNDLVPKKLPVNPSMQSARPRSHVAQ